MSDSPHIDQDGERDPQLESAFETLKGATDDTTRQTNVDQKVLERVGRLESRAGGKKPFVRIVVDLLLQATNLVTGLVSKPAGAPSSAPRSDPSATEDGEQEDE